MQFDPNNKVVKLCAEGMQAEAEGKIEHAHSLFRQAWDIAENDFEAFTAAHYLARNQKDPKDVLKWNLESLARANKIADESMNASYPSLYLNIGKSYEQLNDVKEANKNYQFAADYSSFLPPGKYSDMIKSGIATALTRTGSDKFVNTQLDDLINKWCENKSLRPLSLILTAYIGNLGTESDINKLISALSYLSATQWLEEDEQKIVDGLVRGLVN
jgi:tetratricopeptide (TPR) repeat protein